MTVSQKCQYAVRAVLELAKRSGGGPVTIHEIAGKQAIPPRFLEIILNELKQGGFAQSRRGVQGGYLLAGNPKEVTVGQVVRFVDGPLDPVRCIGEAPGPCCPLKQRCALLEMWSRAKQAVEGVYDSTTFHDLVLRERELDRAEAADYCI